MKTHCFKAARARVRMISRARTSGRARAASSPERRKSWRNDQFRLCIIEYNPPSQHQCPTRTTPFGHGSDNSSCLAFPFRLRQLPLRISGPRLLRFLYHCIEIWDLQSGSLWSGIDIIILARSKRAVKLNEVASVHVAGTLSVGHFSMYLSHATSDFLLVLNF